MRFTKPAWVMHKESAGKSDQNSKRLSIFSVHVHPDGSRIATGGLDAKIRIWSTKPILNSASELSNRPPKSLCTLTMHTGPVLVVRWAHSGRWLASGSDDTIVMIWDLDPSARGKVWGSDEINVEGWKPLKRLPGHESDVTDVAWSPGDRYLASVGLDSKVLIWCGFSLECIRKLDQHQGFVKGVCWDPVGEFLATQSDDRSVKIWRTTDWELEAEVRKPFEDSPGSTFFRRLSWSPDGAHITASNATNNKGFVFIAAVITRNSWTSDISLVGHENTVEVAAYNPHIFLRTPGSPVITNNICSVVALGADDRSVSVWQTKSARPLIVAREVFERQIMDLSWSWDGLTLYAASSDGTIGVFNFDPAELDGIAPHSVQGQYLRKFGFTPPPLPPGFSHQAPIENTPSQIHGSSSRTTPPPSPPRTQPSQQQQQVGFGPAVNGVGGEQVNKLVAKRGNKNKDKKRIQPTFMSNVPSASSTINGTASSSIGMQFGSSKADLKPPILSHTVPISGRPLSNPPTSATRNSFPPASEGFNVPIDVDVDFSMGMDMDVPIDALSTSSNRPGKRKVSAIDLTDDTTRNSKPRTLGGDRPREVGVVKEIGGMERSVIAPVAMGVDVIPIPPVVTYLSMELGDDLFEGRNSENLEPTEIMFTTGKQTQFLDYLPSPVLSLAVTTTFCAAGMLDGSINVYSLAGRRLMPTLSLGSPCAFMDGNRHSLMVVTASAQLYSWNVKKQTATFPPTSLVPLLSIPSCTILAATVRPNGAPIIHCSTGVAHSYDPALCAWMKLSDIWYSEGSDVWQGRQRSSSTSNGRGIVSGVESAIATSSSIPEDSAERPRPKWWTAALTLGHLETKLHSAKMLDSPAEYKQALLVYAKKIADDAFRNKAEELIKELFGPVYWRPGREDGWSPTVLGLAKRDLLREVLLIFARSKTLAKLALDWQDVWKKASTDEY